MSRLDESAPPPGSIARVSRRSRWLGAGFVLAAVLFQALWLGLPGVLLSALLVACYALWIATDWHVTRGLRATFFLGILVFFAHFAEEYATGLQTSLPALFERPPWSDRQLFVFNLAWALVFVAAAFTLRVGRALPAFVVLFFAVAGGVGNGAVHLLLVLQQGAYFPGAWTAPLCLLVGARLLILLYAPQSVALESPT